MKFSLNDGDVHEYLFDDNKVNYLVVSTLSDDDKNIKLCSEVDSCSFTYNSDENKLTLNMTIGSLVYNNIFNIK